MSRSKAREAAFKVLYAREVSGDYQPENSSEFTGALVAGTEKHLEEIDKNIESHLDDWRLDRIYPVERVLLRLATYELLWTETPKPIVIDEAVELAKKYGSEDSASFVNGILDNFNGKVRP